MNKNFTNLSLNPKKTAQIVKGEVILVNAKGQEISGDEALHIDEDNEGAQNDTKYTRTVVPMDSHRYMSFTYLITADDTHNDVTFNIYATNKTDYVLPDEDTAIVADDMIFEVSTELLGNAAGVTINNGSSGDNVCLDIPTKFHTFIFEFKYEEDDTSDPANAVDVYILRY